MRPTPPPGTERLYALYQLQLTHEDPVLVQRHIKCEIDQIFDRYGWREGDRRVAELGRRMKTVETPEARRAERRIDAELANHVFSGGEDACKNLPQVEVLPPLAEDAAPE